MKGRRFVVLDRDGTIVEKHHYLLTTEQVKLLPGAAAGLRRMRSLGMGLVVVTNQSPIARGLLTPDGLDRIHARLDALLADEGVCLDGVFYCPHAPEAGCRCRKPETQLVEAASHALGFSLPAIFVVGDSASDVVMGQRLGATTLLVSRENGDDRTGGCVPDHVVADLREAADVIATHLSAGTPE